MRDNLVNIIRMGLWGLPGILFAFLLNYIFNEFFQWNVYGSYILVTLIISGINFFIVDRVVFKGDKNKKLQKRFVGYFSVVFSSKVGEWLSYSLLVWLGVYYLLAQLIVSVCFLIYKFFFLKKVHI